VHLAWGETTWVPTHAPKILVTRPGSVSAVLTCYAFRLPPGTWPSHGSSLSQWFSNGGAYCRDLMSHAHIHRELGISLLELGVWLGNHLSRLLLLFRVPRPARGLHAPTVPPHTVPPPPRSFLPMGIGGWHHSDMSTSWSEASQRLRPDQPPFLTSLRP